jgi:Ser/Thr protein kinase RdoA (MazF antagonist)
VSLRGEEASQGVNDAAVVGRVLREYHARGIDPAALRRVGGAVQSGIVTYLVHPDGAGPWVVRACRADAPVPIHLSGSPATMEDWLLSRAATLDCLEAAGYPAPRVVRTRPGDPVGTDGMWLTLATTFVEGPLIRPSLAQLRMLGMALGRLHALGVAGKAAGVAGVVAEAGSRDVAGAVPGHGVAGGAGRASWYPEAAIPATLGRLDAVGALVPDDWQSLYAQFGRTARAVQHSLGGLPRGVVHGDAWPGNAVQTGPDSVTLVDWETSGLGLPVLDLGHCLIESLLDAQSSADGPAAWLVEPDEDRVGAVAAGYASERRLGAAERALLPEAVRFGACYVGAIHLYRALAEGVSGTSMDARLERLRNRVEVSEAVARLAAPHLTDGAETVR